jgi:hypothetical protein
VKNPVGGGYRELRSKYSNKGLGIKDSSTDVGASAVQYTCNGHPDQMWYLTAP